MTPRKLAMALTVIALSMASTACFDDDDAAPSGAVTLTQFAISDITGNTRDDTEPVELNDLFVDTSSENPADYDGLLPTS
jgi:hypothetical protein